MKKTLFEFGPIQTPRSVPVIQFKEIFVNVMIEDLVWENVGFGVWFMLEPLQNRLKCVQIPRPSTTVRTLLPFQVQLAALNDSEAELLVYLTE